MNDPQPYNEDSNYIEKFQVFRNEWNRIQKKIDTLDDYNRSNYVMDLAKKGVILNLFSEGDKLTSKIKLLLLKDEDGNEIFRLRTPDPSLLGKRFIATYYTHREENFRTGFEVEIPGGESAYPGLTRGNIISTASEKIDPESYSPAIFSTKRFDEIVNSLKNISLRMDIEPK